ncbi:MAG: hypothetical protein LBD46_08860 [Endomicrobium sp.]|jgi:hypothetical protein|nr:hypothetical protein [Endomicrobium sp.]
MDILSFIQNCLSGGLFKKSIIVILICSVLLSCDLYAQQDSGERIDMSFNAGDVGFGMLIKNNEHTSFVSINLLNFYIEDPKTDLGLKLSPFYYIESIKKGYFFRKISLLNADIYWNSFIKAKKTAMVVPFVSVSYFTYDKQGMLDMSDISFSTGWRFVYIGRGNSRFRYDTYAQAGYRYFDNEHYYFFTLNLDFTIFAVLLLLMSH